MPRADQDSTHSSRNSCHPYRKDKRSENVNPTGKSLTPICDLDEQLRAAKSLTAKQRIVDADIKKIANELAAPRPIVAPYHNGHPVVLTVDQGTKDQMNVGRWYAKVSMMAILCDKKLINYQCKGFKPAEGCYIKHVSDPLGYDIVLNSEPLATRLAQRREINSGFATNRSHRQALAGTSRANIIANRALIQLLALATAPVSHLQTQALVRHHRLQHHHRSEAPGMWLLPQMVSSSMATAQ